MKKAWITVLWSLSVLTLTQGERCYVTGSTTNDREFMLTFWGKQEVLMCDGMTVFNPATCSCEAPNNQNGCDKRPLSRDGTIFQTLTLETPETWVDQTCPRGTVFNRKDCYCNFQRSNPFSLPNSECYMEDMKSKTRYKLVIDNRVHVRSCAANEFYDPKSCSCVRVKPKCDKREADRLDQFLQWTSEKKWSKPMPCAGGTIFNMAKCRCDHIY